MSSFDPTALRGKSLLIFDPLLASRWGHWYEHDLSVARMHHALGAHVTVVCNKDFAHLDDFTDLGAKIFPIIDLSPWQNRDPIQNIFHELSEILRFASNYRNALTDVMVDREFDCVFHPNSMASDLLTWCLMPRKIHRRTGRIVLATWIPLGTYGSSGLPKFARKLAFWRLLAKWLRVRLGNEKWAFMTDSRRLGKEYGKISGMRPNELSCPRSVPQSSTRPMPTSIVYGSPGAARMDKGIDVLQDAIEELVASNSITNLRFSIQWNRAVTGASGCQVVQSDVLDDHPSVRYIIQDMSSEEYESHFQLLDCVVLPYRRNAYYSRSSGVAVEAACAGIPMIYTADTWLSDFVAEQGAGIAVADGDVAGLAHAILAMAADYPTYKAKAVERSAIARARNSPEAFARVLWGTDAKISKRPAGGK